LRIGQHKCTVLDARLAQGDRFTVRGFEPFMQVNAATQ
jgi:hypothetical protein